MKILIIRNYPNYMEVVNNTYNIQEVGLAKALVRCGNICDILFWTDREEKEVFIPVDNDRKVTVYYRRGKTALKNTIFKNCKELFLKYDILQPCEYNQIQSWILASKYPEKTVIYHGPYYSSFNKRYNLMCKVFDNIFLKKYIKNETVFIVKSNLAKTFLNEKGINQEQIYVGGVGIDAQMLSECGKKKNSCLYNQMLADCEAPKILYIGRFEKRRNIPFIIQIFSEVLKEVPTAKLYMLGDGENEYIESIFKMAKKLRIDKSIVYEKKLEQKYLSAIYEMADVFLLPTEYEIFGMVLLEAMYHRNVVITTYNGGSDILIKHLNNGYICNSRSVSTWSKLVVDSIRDKNKSLLIGENARSTISLNYTWDALVGKFVEVYSRRLEQ